MADARRKASILSRDDASEQLHALFNGVTSGVDGDVILVALSSLDALLELNEMSMDEFNQAMKADKLSELVVFRFRHELRSPSLVVEAFLDNSKAA